MEKVLIGMSGGVDSSVAAEILKRQGFAPVGATLSLYREDGTGQEKDILDAAAVCKCLNIPHYIYDFKDAFTKEVVEPFCDSYLNGLTPNPCILCNKTIKFDALSRQAKKQDIPFIATGHYCKIQYDKGSERMLLIRPADRSKDQTYVLYLLSQDLLKITKMPLADYTKEEIRAIANDLALPVAHRKDSQDICFIPDGDYAAFIKRFKNTSYPEGDYLNENGDKIGRHKGMINYTIGQRKGLGVAFGKPMFVTSKSADTNTVVLGEESSLFFKDVFVKNLNFIPFEKLNAPLKVTAKLRYRHTEESAVIEPIDENTVVVHFDKPQRAPSPGQAAVFYDGDVVVGGGTII